MPACTACGADWAADEFTFGCRQCGGGAMTRPCPVCGGRCGRTWERAVLDSQDADEAHWIGACGLATEQRSEGSRSPGGTRAHSVQPTLEIAMIKLYDAGNGALLGEITEPQLQFLIDQLEEESTRDQDYYIDRGTLDLFTEAGGDPALIELLQRALGNRDGMDVSWSRD